MNNKLAAVILGHIILTFIVMFLLAGAMYLLGNIMIGWKWLTFDDCVIVSGIMIMLAFTIVLFILDKKEKEPEDK